MTGLIIWAYISMMLGFAYLAWIIIGYDGLLWKKLNFSLIRFALADAISSIIIIGVPTLLFMHDKFM